MSVDPGFAGAPLVMPDIVEPAPWLQVMGGKKFDLVLPQPIHVDFTTVATVLARIPRFGGHTEGNADEIYSVAQHSVEGARAILREGRVNCQTAAKAFILHDAHEYIIGDIATPIQQALMVHACLVTGDLDAGRIVKDAISSIKNMLDSVIYPAAGMPWPLDPEIASIVREYDARMCNTERMSRLAPEPYPWHSAIASSEIIDDVDLSQWPAQLAAAEFTGMLYELFGIKR